MSSIEELEKNILAIWNERHLLQDEKSDTFNIAKLCIDKMLRLLDEGKIRACNNDNGNWTLNSWIKKGILLFFTTSKSNFFIQDKICYRDKVLPLSGSAFNQGVRLVPTCYVREGVFLGKNVIVMPAFVNIGAYVGENTMIDSYATIGSCAQIGKNCHISSNSVVAGVLEPLQYMPVIIEDSCFVGAGCVISEGVVVREGSVLGSGVVLTATTKIFNLKSGKITQQEIPAYSVVIPGSIKSANSEVLIQCAVIIKTVDESTRKKTSINELLRQN
jgi:2,3,4,5-tetrahydropyridine-2-carboxylate N-succinyltransferase